MVQYVKSNNQIRNKETEKKSKAVVRKKLTKIQRKQKWLLEKTNKKPKETKAIVRKKIDKNKQKLKTLLQQKLQLLWIMMHYSKTCFTN